MKFSLESLPNVKLVIALLFPIDLSRALDTNDVVLTVTPCIVPMANLLLERA